MTFPRSTGWLALIALHACTGAEGPSLTRARRQAAVDSLVNTEVRRGVPGIAVAVLRAGTLVHSTTRGSARTSPDVPVTDTTPFQLASTTKSISATALLTLVRDQQLRLDAPIGTLLLDLPVSWRPITVRQLLSHTSGLPDIVQSAGTNTLIAPTWADAFGIVATRPLEFTPGSRWSYNQTNYALIARVFEAISRRPFEDDMRQRLFVPADMRYAFYPADSNADRECAHNYSRGPGGARMPRDLSFPSYVHAAAGLCASLRDLIAFDRAISAGRVLTAAQLQELWTPAPLDGGRVAAYGLGWVVDVVDGHRFVGHSGGNATAYHRYLDDSLTVIVLSNGMFDPDQLAGSIAAVYLRDAAQVSASAEEQLWDAARQGDVVGVNAALDAGADINALDRRRSKSGRRALNWAALGDHVDVVTTLLRRGAPVDAANLTGFTALHHAAEAGSLRAARALLAAGASRALETTDGERPADTARRKGHDAVAALVDSAR